MKKLKSLADAIEYYGEKAEKGEMSREEAVQKLLEFSDGGLARKGAEADIDNWRTRRKDYQDLFDQVKRRLAEDS